jgi:putative spermidine/putrescine transport system ATP-binding protein
VVVMNRGRIEQAGTPQQVYRQPRTEFVARFMGGHNVLRGRVTGIDTSYVKLVAGGYPLVVRKPAWRPGMDLAFAVRADKVRFGITAAEADGRVTEQPNTLPATVCSVEYLGAWVQVELELLPAEALPEAFRVVCSEQIAPGLRVWACPNTCPVKSSISATTSSIGICRAGQGPF